MRSHKQKPTRLRRRDASEAQKAPYQREYARLKEVYVAAGGGGAGTRTKREREVAKIKKPPTAFFLFCVQKRGELKVSCCPLLVPPGGQAVRSGKPPTGGGCVQRRLHSAGISAGMSADDGARRTLVACVGWLAGDAA